MANTSRFSQSRNILCVVFCSLTLSACAGGALDRALTNVGEHEVSAPVFEKEADSTGLPVKKHKVTSIEIKAPKSGDEIYAPSGVLRVYQTSQRLDANYILTEDAAPSVLTALKHHFEIDPEAEHSLSATLSINIVGYLKSDFWCKHWVTTSRVNLQLRLIKRDGAETEQNFLGMANDKSCTTQWYFPSGSDIESIVQDGFQQSVDKMLEAKLPKD